MRILLLSAYADPVGGAEIYMHALRAELARRGHTVGLFGTSPEREVDEELTRVVRRAAWDTRLQFRDAERRAALARFVERLRPDLIHLHNVYSLSLDVVRQIASSGHPLLQTVHDLSTVCPNGWLVYADGTPCRGGAGIQCFQHDCTRNYPFTEWQVLLTRLMQQQLTSSIDAFLCPSRFVAGILEQHGFPDVRHFPYFVEPAEPLPPPRAGAAPRLLFLGRLAPEKGVSHLLDAMKLILASEPSARLDIVGDGVLEEELRKKTKLLGLTSGVEFHGKVDHGAVRAHYARASALVLPTIWSENSPLSIHECLSLGLPVIASRIGGIPELIEDGVTGFLFEPRNPRDLADKALRALRLGPQERERMSARMQEGVHALGRAEHVDRLEALYGEILARPRRTPPTAAVPIDADLEGILTAMTKAPDELREYVHKLEHHNRELQRHVRYMLLTPARLARTMARKLRFPKLFK